MMHAIAWASSNDFNRSLEAARSEDGRGELGELAAPLGAAVIGRVADAWDRIEAALQEAWRKGRDFARETAEETALRVQEIVDATGTSARAVQEGLLARLHRYLEELVDRAIARVRASITVAGHELHLAGVELAQIVTLTGSLKLSIQEAFALTSDGQLEVTARYEASRAD
jgi:F0F1-type ATP synthase membrane subunit b/b'